MVLRRELREESRKEGIHWHLDPPFLRVQPFAKLLPSPSSFEKICVEWQGARCLSAIPHPPAVRDEQHYLGRLEVPSGGFSTLKVNAGYRFQMGVELYKTRDHTVDDGRHEGDVSSIRYKPMNTYIVRQSLAGRNL